MIHDEQFIYAIQNVCLSKNAAGEVNVPGFVLVSFQWSFT